MNPKSAHLSSVDVVIIGAGAAGLAAARRLKESSLQFILLEADNRIGGRAHSEIMPDGSVFDLGCHWLHSASINPFVEVADSLNIRYARPEGYGPSAYFKDGKFLPDFEVSQGFEQMEVQRQEMRTAWRKGIDRSVLDTVDREHPFTEFSDYYYALNTSSDIDQTSIGDMVSYNDTGENWPVIDGYGSLVSRWGADVAAHLNTRVLSISWAGTGVRVETPKGSVSAAQAIITTSTGVLASGAIRFTPELPVEKLDAIHALPLGNFNRIRLSIDRRHFAHPDFPERVIVARKDAPPILLSLRPYESNSVIGLSAGRYADWLEKSGPEAFRQASLDALCEVFGFGIRKHVGEDRQSAWRGNPFIRGAYSTSQPGQFYQRTKLAEPIDDKLFFCGEATSADAFCTCHGARLTGERAAAEVLQTRSLFQ